MVTNSSAQFNTFVLRLTLIFADCGVITVEAKPGKEEHSKYTGEYTAAEGKEVLEHQVPPSLPPSLPGSRKI